MTLVTNNPGFGSIYTVEGKTLKWVTNLDENLSKETFILQPGRYRAVFRPRASRESIYTLEKEFSIVSGESNVVIMN